ncbi:hypothetical protein KGEDBEEJ_01214 [Aeromonas hydrophila]|uniref:hypothetical protein n=1 Tax=Aeromonas hydrophila TaxID=644 RepID=UPI000AEE7A80|nr:hypothetical protein [Aeromonas hydrophila]USJ77846.1 hypothetical protein LDP97_01915 [Aeromonas hydrophila]CAD7549279.1 hypothetical protein KBAHV27_33640 [Aeromonas hydrophila]CAD7549392.1 hypothetical protein KBAHV46_33700 [Aeromonas hydrophila]CAD7549426.1 hypothetical protein KBAHV42_33750 [Aeromonas hydrophila]CAD7550704.1 hypothetical protein KBAHV01_33630 [Aeromonas hydrophila]
MYLIKSISIFFVILFFNDAYAFSVDSLFKVDNGKENYLLLKNTSGRTEFVNVRLSHIEVEKGKSVEREFKSDDFMQWPVYATPSSVILDPGGAERVSLVRVNNDNFDDVLIGISLLPDTLSAFGNSVDISVGYKTWFLIPGKSDFKGELLASMKDASMLVLDNKTNKHLSIVLSQCGADTFTDNDCASTLFMLSGTQKQINLSKLKKLSDSKIYIRYSDANQKTVKFITM